MSLSIKIRTNFDGALNAGKRDVERIMRQEFENIGETWHRQHRKRHFTQYGASLYGYEPRKPGYNRRKRNAKGHMLPLVWSGYSRLASRIKSVRVVKSKGQYRAIVVMPAVRVLNFRNPKSSINMRREFETIAPSEYNQYEKEAAPRIERKLSRLPAKRKRG